MTWEYADRTHEPARTEHLKSSDADFGLAVASKYEVRKVLWKDVITWKAALGQQARDLGHAWV
jgi:hypothetical protein